MKTKEQPPISDSIVLGSDRLFLFFGGIAGGVGMPPFEFYRAGAILDCSKIFLRDSSQSWYQQGLPTIGDDIHAVARFLEGRIVASGASQVVFVGNSMGGFAALLFCSLLKCGKAVAFAPQTFISSEKRRFHNDRRWSQEISRMHSSRRGFHVYDLEPFIRDSYPSIRADVYVSISDELDMAHARYLEDFENVVVNKVSGPGHLLVKHYRDIGLLPGILNAP